MAQKLRNDNKTSMDLFEAKDKEDLINTVKEFTENWGKNFKTA